jgi:UDP:flavonoid glycosyltransferase YjiC (YdhE family)
MATVVFYVTGHGFGHAVRQTAIIDAFAAHRPDVGLVVRTSVAPWLFARGVPASVRLEPGPVDTGAIQRGSLDVDVPATLAAAQAFYADAETWIDAEVARLRRLEASLIVADIPPLAFAAARRAGLPAIGISNFTWDWIYEDYDALA